MNPSADKLFGTVTNAWMPWLGKKLYPEENRGENTLTKSAVVPSKLLWPLYSTSDSPLGRTGFDFTTYVEAGELDPSVEVLVIDYSSVSSNPRLLIRQIATSSCRSCRARTSARCWSGSPAARSRSPRCTSR